MADRDLAAAWLTPSCLALVGALGDAEPEVRLESGGDRVAVKTRYLQLAPESAGVLLVALPHAGIRARETLTLGMGEDATTLTEAELRDLTADMADVVRRRLAPLDAERRAAVTDFLATSVGMAPAGERFELSARLRGFRGALREQLPRVTTDPARHRGMGVDRLMAVADDAFFVEGWMHFEDTGARRLTAVSPEGARVELLDQIARVPRPEVAETLALPTQRLRERIGFLCHFSLAAPSLEAEGWLLEFEDAHGEQGEAEAPRVITEPLDVRDALLEDAGLEKIANEALMRDHLHPAVMRIQEAAVRPVEIDSVVQHGTPPESPQVTIVVPLYRQLEHLEVQLSQFADDPGLHETDLVYVLDSPEDAAALRGYAADLHAVYGVPFRVASLDVNVGFAGACNAGASLSRGRLLLLLNSDVLPAEPGWLSLMRDFYDSTPQIGALGPKLLYEDDSIQHAGMHFVRFPDPGLRLWIDATYYKGMHTSLPAANVARPVPAVSGACLMIGRELWDEVGGLPRMYVRGDYEDSHLCLELHKRGRENWYLPQAQLYHLEGQSYAPDMRAAANRFNSWVYSRIWEQRLESMTAR